MANYTNIQYKNAIIAVLSYFRISLNEINVLEAVRRLEENGVESDVPDSLGETKAVLLEFENLYHWNYEKVKAIFGYATETGTNWLYTDAQYKDALRTAFGFMGLSMPLTEPKIAQAVIRLSNSFDAVIPVSFGDYRTILIEFKNRYSFNLQKVISLLNTEIVGSVSDNPVDNYSKNPVDLPKPTKKKDIPVVIKKQNFLVKLILIFVKPFKKIKTK